MNAIIRYLIYMLLLIGFSCIASAQTVIIVHPENTLEKASRADISNIFLGKKTQWDGGGKIIAVDHKKDSKPGKAFLDVIVKMSENEYKNYWVEKMLSGEAEPPKNFSSDEDILKFVKANKGAIGYISAENVQEGVKVIPVDDKKEW
ncbi:substrate-binding domain-containing protein [candidate division KSB1 bacterium]|nr:substrate-binding domain-containing protein [candidate division KSB1 bacterium]